jgi:hypothetical protein
MSTPDTVNFDPGQPVVPADLNRIGTLAGKGIMDRFLELVGGIDSAVEPRNVVARGLDLTPGRTLELPERLPAIIVVVSAGELFRFEPTGWSVNVSRYRLGVLHANTNQSLNPADGVNPRIDLISVRETSILTNHNRTQQASLTITYTPGTPARYPTIPRPPAGEVAIWAIVVPAGARSLTDDNFMDLRVPLNTYAFSRAHHMLERIACSAAAGISATSASFQTGRAVVNGAIVDNLTEKTFTGNELLEGVPGRIVVGIRPNTQYHVYLVGKGSGDPVGKTVADGVIFVMSTTRPSEDGRPSLRITYRPFSINRIPPWSYRVQFTTVNALYVGTLTTDENGAFEPFGSGLPINRNGSATIAAASSFDGIFPARIGFIKAPHFSWVGVDSVRVGAYAAVVAGFPATYGPITATMGANLDWANLDSRERSSTWYYVYLRLAQTSTGKLGAIRTHDVVISSEPPDEFGCKPTPQPSFNSFDYLYVGSFFNNEYSDIEPFAKEGNHVLFRNGMPQVWWGAPAVYPLRSTVTVPMPATSRMALLVFNGYIWSRGPTEWWSHINIYSAPRSSLPVVDLTVHQPKDIFFPVNEFRYSSIAVLGPLPLSLSAAGQFELQRVLDPPRAGAAVDYLGYIEDIHAPIGPALPSGELRGVGSPAASRS